MDITEVIAQAKQRAGLSSDYALSKKLKVSRSAVHNWLNDIGAPSTESALELAAMSGVEPMRVVAACEARRAREPSAVKFWSSIANGEVWRKR